MPTSKSTRTSKTSKVVSQRDTSASYEVKVYLINSKIVDIHEVTFFNVSQIDTSKGSGIVVRSKNGDYFFRLDQISYIQVTEEK